MLDKKYLMIVTLFILLISLNVAFAQDNATESNLNDKLADNNLNHIIDIQKEIDDANENDVIELGNNSFYGKSISINKNLTFNGNNETIFYYGSIESSNHEITFKNITFTKFGEYIDSKISLNGSTIFINCIFNENEGEIFCEGNNIFENCIFKNNENYIGYGAISVKGTSTFTNCSFENNHAYAGGAIDSNGDLTIINCSFVNNSAEIAGAIYSHYADVARSVYMPDNVKYSNPKKNNVHIINSKFLDNHADYVGVIFSSQNLIIDNSSFINNNAKFMGVIFSTADLIINKSEFLKNKAVTEKNSEFAENGLISVINSIYGKTKIFNSEFKDNTAKYATISLSKTDFEMDKNTFSGNSLGTIFIGDCTSKYPKYTILNDDLKSIKVFKLTTKAIVTTYWSNSNFKVVAINPITSKPIEGAVIEASYKEGKSATYISSITNKNGVAYVGSPVGSGGKHTINLYIYSFSYWEGFSKITSSITINKIPTTVKAPKVTFKYKKSKYFKVTVKNGKKPLKQTYIKIKIGKKTYSVKTNSKGVAKFNTKKLKVGKYKVVISSNNKYYKISGKSTIKIKR